MRLRLVLLLAVILPGCAASGDSDQEQAVVETKVAEILTATAEAPTPTLPAEQQVATGVAQALTATASIQPTSSPTATANPATATPIFIIPTRPAPTSPPDIRATVDILLTPTVPADPAPPTPTSPADDYARRGYYPFDRPELALMIHPRLVLDDVATDEGENLTGYDFRDFNAPYLIFEITIWKTSTSRNSITEGLIESMVSGVLDRSEHISSYEFVANEATGFGGHSGRILRYRYVSNGDPAYGATLAIAYDEWVYIFDAYGDDYEYQTIEDIIRSVFVTAFLRGPSQSAWVARAWS
jgi:hypothetical protein